MITVRLKELLEEKQLTRYWLAKTTEIAYPTIDRYYKNEIVRYDSYVLNKICQALDCTPNDLLYYEKDDSD